MQVYNAQRAGAFAALVYNNANNGFVKMKADSGWKGAAVSMPSAFIPASTARPLLQAILAGEQLTLSTLNWPAELWQLCCLQYPDSSSLAVTFSSPTLSLQC